VVGRYCDIYSRCYLKYQAIDVCVQFTSERFDKSAKSSFAVRLSPLAARRKSRPSMKRAGFSVLTSASAFKITSTSLTPHGDDIDRNVLLYGEAFVKSRENPSMNL